MTQDNLARRLEPSSQGNRPMPHAAEPLGRVVSVGGSQVIVEFSNGVLSNSDTDLTVGAFLGVWNGRTMIVGSLCDISLHKLADGQQSGPATGRVDLLGELILDKPGAGYFQRGVTGYPKLDSPLMPIGHDALSIIFDTSGPNTINIGYLQQDSSIGAYIDVDNMVRKHFAIFGSTGAGKSSAVSVLLRGIKRDQVQRGQVVALPGSVTPHQRFRARLYALTTAEGGRHTPFLANYRPQFYFRTTDVVGSVDLGDLTMVLPGDTVDLSVELGRPIAMDVGLGFAVREGGRTVAAGTVTELLD